MVSGVRIGELSRRSGVAAASIKYYTREGLLPAGARTGYNQTDYDDAHVARLRVIRTLISVGGLSVAAAKRVLDAIDDDGITLDHAFGIAQHSIPTPTLPPSNAAVERVRDLMRRRGWMAHDANPGILLTASILDAYAAIDRGDLGDAVDGYADAVESIADMDLDLAQRAGDRIRMAETVVVGTVLGDALIAGLRRIAQEDRTHRRLGTTVPAEPRRRPDLQPTPHHAAHHSIDADPGTARETTG